MTKNDFKELTKNPLLLDGATGSNLMAAGMPRGVFFLYIKFPSPFFCYSALVQKKQISSPFICFSVTYLLRL